MQNIKAIINNHNMNILHQNNEIKDECNYRKKKYCPLGRKCLSPNIVYLGKITSTQPNYNAKNYSGVAEKSFTDADYSNDTELSKHTLLRHDSKG